MRRRASKFFWLLLGVVLLVVALGVAAPFIYIHFIEGPAPAKLELPKVSHTTSTVAGQDAGGNTSSVAGVWNVGGGSLAGYRVNEVLIGQNSTAVGRTSKVWGSITITGTAVTKATVTVDMASVASDQSERNAHFDGPIMDVAQYPTATLSLSSPIELGSIPDAGVVGHYGATGSLSMHGVTKTVSFSLSAERAGSQIDVLADINVPFAEWDIANPSIGGFVTTADNGTLEVLLHLVRGAGNPASMSSGPNPVAGGGGPPTVPSTTVPPLTVPSG